MDSLSSDQLLTIVTQQRKDYEPEALEAAEKILQQRGVSYEVPQTDASDINEEIKDRLNAGERPETVLLDLKERGISSLDFLPGIVKEENEIHAEIKDKRKNKWAKIAGISVVVISIIRILIILATRH
jgi:acyl carrier protein